MNSPNSGDKISQFRMVRGENNRFSNTSVIVCASPVLSPAWRISPEGKKKSSAPVDVRKRLGLSVPPPQCLERYVVQFHNPDDEFDCDRAKPRSGAGHSSLRKNLDIFTVDIGVVMVLVNNAAKRGRLFQMFCNRWPQWLKFCW